MTTDQPPSARRRRAGAAGEGYPNGAGGGALLRAIRDVLGVRQRRQAHGSPIDVDEGDTPTPPPVALPTAATSLRRATVVWWVVFSGPVVIIGALLVAGIVSDQRATVVLVFTLGVWAFSLTLGLAASPEPRPGVWWVAGALVMSFLSAAAAFGLLYAVSELSNNIDSSTIAPDGSPNASSSQQTQTE